MLNHVGGAEPCDPDGVGEAGQGVELMLIQRDARGLGHGLHDRDQVVLQQKLGLGFRNGRALARGQGVAVADDPAAVFALNGPRAKALEALDQHDPLAGDLRRLMHVVGHV